MAAAGSPQLRLKAAVSVTTMARMVGLSRSRFYDYVRRNVFPQPVYSLATRRPFYTTEMQQDILAARQTGIGCNGEYVIFYEKQPKSEDAQPAARRPSLREPVAELVEGLKSLGLTAVTLAQVGQAVAATFPNGVVGIDEAVVLRTLYRHLRRLNGA